MWWVKTIEKEQQKWQDRKAWFVQYECINVDKKSIWELLTSWKIIGSSVKRRKKKEKLVLTAAYKVFYIKNILKIDENVYNVY